MKTTAFIMTILLTMVFARIASAQQKPTTGYAPVNGLKMYYEIKGSGEPVVLLHGGLVDGRDFDGNLAGLDTGHRVLVPDRRAHGRSHDDGGPLALDTLAADSAMFIETVVGSRVALVGYSAGTMVALRVAIRRPELVDRLVLISGAFDPAGMLLRPAWRLPVRCPSVRHS